MLAALVDFSIRSRTAMVCLLVLLLGAGLAAAARLPIDAVPDISTTQVSVLTAAQGLSSEEIERTVSFPIENAVNGIPGMVELRSISRAGLSAVTVIFRDGTDPWFARQLVLERIRAVEQDLPPSAGTPELAPLSTGLGEIYQFVVRSPFHDATQLRTILDWEIVPQLRSVPGVIEINTMGGKLKQFHVVVDPTLLQAKGLGLGEVADALRRANVNVGGGYVERGPESLTLRGVGVLQGATDIENVVVQTSAEGVPVLVQHVARVEIGQALPHGIVTHDGESIAVSAIVMMLPGSNSRTVVAAVQRRIAEIARGLPAGLAIEPIYDRADFVERTVRTVLVNLAEGAAIVAVVLTVMLGSVGAAFVAVLGIPAAMTFALFGMLATGTTGDLMSLGAIDFGFLVDGPVVVLEVVLAHGMLGIDRRARILTQTARIRRVARPVAFSVAIITLVYLPLLSLQGVEGKMFTPMATTMAFALAGALIYSVLFMPALVVVLVRGSSHGFGWVGRGVKACGRLVPFGIRHSRWLVTVAAALTIATGWLLARGGADFMPRIDEGDLVVTIRRPPSIGLDEAERLDRAVQHTILGFPEAMTTLAMTGRAEVAIDPVGKDNTDVFVRLLPPQEWTTAADLDGLSAALKKRIESEVPSTFVSVSQPIEDRTNELISGSRADVQIMIYGNELEVLARLADAVRHAVADVTGTGDVRVERLLGAPELSVRVDRERLARYGATVSGVLSAVEAARVGIPLGWVFEGQRRVGLHLLAPPRAPTVEAVGDLLAPTGDGSQIRLSEVASIEEREGPAAIRRQDRMRTVRVEVNLRGRDLASWVAEARAHVAEEVPLPSGYRVEWGGQFENFQRAAQRLSWVAPAALLIVFAMLVVTFGDVRYAAAIFLVVPFSLAGGALGLAIRGLSFSIPAAVGCIALAGVSVLNGVVVGSEVRARIAAGSTVAFAVVRGTKATVRTILTTAAVAALGFLPMALATSAGAEVQRPLATVVVFGIGLSALLTLLVLPALLLALVRPDVAARE